MLKYSLLFFILTPFVLFSQLQYRDGRIPYYSVHDKRIFNKEYIIIFRGRVVPGNIPEVEDLTGQFMQRDDKDFYEQKHLRIDIEQELNRYGIQVSIRKAHVPGPSERYLPHPYARPHLE